MQSKLRKDFYVVSKSYVPQVKNFLVLFKFPFPVNVIAKFKSSLKVNELKLRNNKLLINVYMQKFNATCRTVESNPNRTIKTETIQTVKWYTIMF